MIQGHLCRLVLIKAPTAFCTFFFSLFSDLPLFVIRQTMAASTAASPTPTGAHHEDPSNIGRIFAHEYYTFLNKEPSSVHKFYIDNATMTHGHQGGSVTISQGLKASSENLSPSPF